MLLVLILCKSSCVVDAVTGLNKEIRHQQCPTQALSGCLLGVVFFFFWNVYPSAC